MIISITAQAKANGRPTSIGSQEINLSWGSEHLFTVENFTTETSPQFVDPEGDILSYIKILELPESGSLEISGVSVEVGDIIQAGVLVAGDLSYTPDSNIENNNSVTLKFDAADTGSETLSGLDTGYIYFSIQAKPNYPPSNIDDGTVNTSHSTTVIFTKDTFTQGYVDPEGDEAYSIKVLTLPSSGTLQLDGVDVIVNQEILLSEIDAGYLTLIPNALEPDDAYSTSFSFSISDTGSGQFTE